MLLTLIVAYILLSLTFNHIITINIIIFALCLFAIYFIMMITIELDLFIASSSHDLYRKYYPFNTPPKPRSKRPAIKTFFFQGHNGARGPQASKYCGKSGVHYYYKGKYKKYLAVCPNSPKILHNIHCYKELPEIGYYSMNLWHHITRYMNGVRQIAFGIRAEYPMSNVTRWNVGGDPDVAFYLKNFRKMLAMTKNDKKIVCFGCSRGAATTLIAISKMTPGEQARIALVLVESPFDTFPNVLNSWPLLRPLAGIQLYLIEKLAMYKPNQMTPLEAIGDWPGSVPIGFITTDLDTTVPKHLTMNLIEKLKANGHEKVYHLDLKNSSHDDQPLVDPVDQQRYMTFVDDLYDMYT